MKFQGFSVPRWALAIPLGLVLLLSGCLTNQPRQAEQTPGDGSSETVTPTKDGIDLLVELKPTGNPNIAVAVNVVTEPLTVIQLMDTAARRNGFQFEYTGRGELAFVRSIAGIEGGKNGAGYWLFEVNGQLGKKSAGISIVKPGDSVKWRLGQFPEQE